MPRVDDIRDQDFQIDEDVRMHHDELRELLLRTKSRDLEFLELTADLPDNTTIKVRMPGKREWKYEFGSPNSSGSGTGEGDSDEFEDSAPGKSGSRAGSGHVEHDYEIEIGLGEYRDMVFEAWKLPPPRIRVDGDSEQSEIHWKGFRDRGIDAKLSRKRTAKLRLRRFRASRLPNDELKRFPFRRKDFRYYIPEIKSGNRKAVIVLGRDVSGSISQDKREIISIMMLWLSMWIMRRYPDYKVARIGHDENAFLIDDFVKFITVQSGGGTDQSSFFKKVEEIERGRASEVDVAYPADEWDYYIFYASDGENFGSKEECEAACRRVAGWARLVAYIEVDPANKPFGTYTPHLMRNKNMSDVLYDLAQTLPRKNMVVTAVQKSEQIRGAIEEILNHEVIGDA